jgi:phenylalanyl-tRNA synthetase alpha chain
MESHQDILKRALEQILAAQTSASLKDIEREFLGKKGAVAALLASIPNLPAEQRPDVGKNANILKKSIQRALDDRGAELAESSLSAERSGEGFDPTLPPARLDTGSLHPLTQVTRELEDLFLSMGYTILDGPEVELDSYDFKALNIGPDHPARDSQDTFYCDDECNFSLRPHTSPVQVRAMERLDPPFRVVAPGRCFRNETTDASHEHTFYQMEGMVVGKDISVGHLIGAMKTLLRGIFHREVEVRLRPGHFPFVEPGFELDARCPFCETGCSVCGRTTWIELLPCGLVHPNVLKMSGIDPEVWSGFAFGLGLSRLVMLRYNIDDVRHLFGGDLRFLEQF